MATIIFIPKREHKKALSILQSVGINIRLESIQGTTVFYAKPSRELSELEKHLLTKEASCYFRTEEELKAMPTLRATIKLTSCILLALSFSPLHAVEPSPQKSPVQLEDKIPSSLERNEKYEDYLARRKQRHTDALEARRKLTFNKNFNAYARAKKLGPCEKEQLKRNLLSRYNAPISNKKK